MRNEANVSAEHPASQKDSRVPDPHEHQSRPGSDRAPAGQGPGTSVGLKGRTEATLDRPRSNLHPSWADGRLRTPQEFRRVLRGGRSRRSGELVVHVRERDGGGQPRLGLVVPRAVGGAVERNLIKRRIREIWRAVLPEAGEVDCVVVVRGGGAALGYRELAHNIEASLLKMQVLAKIPAGES